MRPVNALSEQASEAEFQRAVIELAQMTSWLCAHFRPARTADGGWRTAVAADGAGFPDLLLVHRQRGTLFRELKSESGTLTPEQKLWLDTLTDAGADAAVWRPSDWPDVEATLTGR